MSTTQETPLALSLRGVTKHYFKPDGSLLVEALRGIDIDIKQGEYVAIMGASGSGKSTLLNILGCLDRPTDGQYILEGRDVSNLDDLALSRIRGHRIGFVFQAFNLISELAIVENVEVPLFYQGIHRTERHQRALQRLKDVGLGDRTLHRPAELSGGEQQRAAMARGLVTNPAILLADEPTGNLDSETEASIMAIFDDLHAKGLTIIMITHERAVANRSQRIIWLKDGCVDRTEETS